MLLTARHVFGYGLLSMLSVVALYDFAPTFARLADSLSLHELMTWPVGSGMSLTLVGLFLAEWQGHSASAPKKPPGSYYPVAFE